MATLLTVDSVIRSPDLGFRCLPFSHCNQLHVEPESDLLVIEPSFLSFEKADNDRLGFLFKLGQEIKNVPVLPKKVVLCLAYSQRNANTMKGWILDVVAYYKSLGYQYFTSTHIPYEAHGCPMVGSTLALVFCQDKFAFVPTRKLVLPNEVIPDLMYHAPAARVKGSVYAGTAGINGFMNSRLQFLPDLSLWDSASPGDP